MKKLLVIIESPFAARNGRTVDDNIAYARDCVRDSLNRGESPVAFHLLHTQPGILDDQNPEQRALGISASLEWYRKADRCAVYVDHGISGGMLKGMNAAVSAGVRVERRSLVEPER